MRVGPDGMRRNLIRRGKLSQICIVSIYKIWTGAKYEIRDYLVTVTKKEKRNFEIEVHEFLGTKRINEKTADRK